MVVDVSKFFKKATEGIVFDIDGTWMNTPPFAFAWFQHWAKLDGKKLGYDDLRGWLKEVYNPCIDKGGFSEVYKYHDLPDDSHLPRKESKVWTAYDKFKEENQDLITVYPGAAESFNELKKLGKIPKDKSIRNHAWRFGVVSTNTWGPFYDKLDEAGLIDGLLNSITLEDMEKYDGNGNGKKIVKPSKISIDTALNLLNTNGETTIYVGDTRSDLKACINVMRTGNPNRFESLRVIGAAWGYEGRELLSRGVVENGIKYHFTEILDHPMELVDFAKTYLK